MDPQLAWRARSRRALVLLVAAAVVLALGALAAQARAAPDYVGLGDSYAAGPLIPNQVAPLGCLRSDHDYAHLARPGIGLPLFDASCSGATTYDMTHPQEVELGSNPPQLDALSATTRLVTLTIGGNDIGFSEVAQECITINPFSTPCRDRYDAGGRDQLAERIAATAPKVAAVIDAIHARAPRAKVLVLDYPAIFPESGSGCWPQMPIGWGDVPYLRRTEQGLNAMLKSQAAAHGATLVDWYGASIGHDACRSLSSRWVEPLVPGQLAAPIHPNLAGMRAAAGLVVANR